jgi:hypothetical protein
MSDRSYLNVTSAIPGSVVAVMMSYAINKSLLWAIFHCICGWMYVCYWLFTYTDISNWINSWVVY